MLLSTRLVKKVVLLALLATLVLVVGWFWFGWGHIRANKALLDSLPVYSEAQRIQVSSNPRSDDETFLTPPEGWGTRAVF